MKQISLDNVKRWISASSNSLSHPVSINTVCPKCLLNVVFATRRRHYDPLRDTLACSAECPSCNVEIHFWMTSMMTLADASEEKMPELYMLPSTESRLDLAEISDLLPENVMQSCTSTQDVYQNGNLTATRVMVQSTLQAIFASFLPPGNSQTTLSKTVQDALPSIDIDLPMTNLATSLRKGEHLDKLLSNQTPATRETADALMLLVEKLVCFLYVVPRQFEELDKRLAELSRQLCVENQTTKSNSAEDQDS